MRVNKLFYFAIIAIAALMSFVVFKGKSEGAFNPLLTSEKLPKWLSFIIEKKA